MDTDRVFFSHGFLSAFIKEYRNHRCLWDPKSKAYVNNIERMNAWEDLLAFCRTKLNDVDLNWLKRKVHSMKGSFNKELKKMRDARRAGFTGEWQPKLWYYENLLFTKEHEIDDGSMFKKGEDKDSEYEGQLFLAGDSEGVDENSWYEEHKGETNSTEESETAEAALKNEEQESGPPPRKRKLSQVGYHVFENRKSPLDHVQVELGKPDDEDDVYDSIGKVVTSKLRALGNSDYTQFIRVDKLITEAIYRGFQKQLTPESKISLDGHDSTSNHPLVSISTNPGPPTTTSPRTYNIFLPQNPPSTVQIPSYPTSTGGNPNHRKTCNTASSQTLEEVDSFEHK